MLYACCLNGTFALFRIEYVGDHNPSLIREEIAEKSAPLLVLGSGRELFENQYKKEPETSYSVFHAFGKVIHANFDKKVGGAPQIVSLYSDGRTNLFGLSYFGSKSLLGLDASAASCPSAIEWRNENFERWGAIANEMVRGAQRQPSLNV